MSTNQCPQCGRRPSDDESAGPTVTRDLILEWMRASQDSAADFFEAVAIYFGIEDEEIEGR